MTNEQALDLFRRGILEYSPSQIQFPRKESEVKLTIFSIKDGMVVATELQLTKYVPLAKIKRVIKLSLEGNKYAQYTMYLMIVNGIGFIRDTKLGLKWLELSCLEGGKYAPSKMLKPRIDKSLVRFSLKEKNMLVISKNNSLYPLHNDYGSPFVKNKVLYSSVTQFVLVNSVVPEERASLLAATSIQELKDMYSKVPDTSLLYKDTPEKVKLCIATGMRAKFIQNRLMYAVLTKTGTEDLVYEGEDDNNSGKSLMYIRDKIPKELMV